MLSLFESPVSEEEPWLWLKELNAYLHHKDGYNSLGSFRNNLRAPTSVECALPPLVRCIPCTGQHPWQTAWFSPNSNKQAVEGEAQAEILPLLQNLEGCLPFLSLSSSTCWRWDCNPCFVRLSWRLKESNKQYATNVSNTGHEASSFLTWV